MRATLFCLALAVWLPAFGQDNSGADYVATAALIRGSVMVRTADHETRELAVGSRIFLGDTIETEKRSFAVLVFVDESKLTLQPNSQLEVEEFEAGLGEESIVLELIKGGLRAITGRIGKLRPEAVLFKARRVTVGIRGTTFALRLCNIGEAKCEFQRGITEAGEIASNETEGQRVRIFVRGNSSGLDSERREISREDFTARLGDTYAWLIEGKITVTTPENTYDLETVRECLPREMQQGPFPGPLEPHPCVPPLEAKDGQPIQPPFGANKAPKQPKLPKPPKR